MATLSSQEAFVKKERQKKLSIIFFRTVILITFLFLWELTSRLELIDSFIFGSPSIIILCFMELLDNGFILYHIGITFIETLISFLLVNFTGIAFATVIWLFPRLSKILEPYLIILNSLPKSALAPLLIVWLGANTKTIVLCGMSVAIFGTIITLHTSFNELDADFEKLILTLHGNKSHIFTKVVLPASVPIILSTAKVNIGLCLVGVIIGEFLASRAGLGYLIIYGSQVFKMNWLLLSIILLCIMAMLFYNTLSFLEKVISKRF